MIFNDLMKKLSSKPSGVNFNKIKLFAAMSLLAFVLQYCSTPSRTASSRPAAARNTKPDKEEALRQDIVSFAKKYTGKNYLAAGKSPSTGFDCSGFTSYVMGNFNIKLSPSAREQVKQGVQKSVQNAQPGDLVFFRRQSGDPIFHVAMVVSNNGKSLNVIHSTTSRGVVIDDILASTYWKPKIDSVREVLK